MFETNISLILIYSTPNVQMLTEEVWLNIDFSPLITSDVPFDYFAITNLPSHCFSQVCQNNKASVW